MAQLLQDQNIDEILENLRYLIKAEQTNFILPIITELHPSDIAEILSHLNEEERKAIFGLLDSEKASDVLVELGESVAEDVLEELDTHQIAKMVNEMDSDDAADILSDLPPHQVAEVLQHMEEEILKRMWELRRHEG